MTPLDAETPPEALTVQQDPMMAFIERVSKDKDFDEKKFQALLDARDRERDYQSRVSFDEALSRCQSKLERIAADSDNPQTHSRYASYAKLDRAIRPIYTSEGFSISYGEKDCPYPGKTRFVAYVSRSGVTREYLKDLTPSTKGPKGNDVMTPIHADGSAGSYAKRYLLKDIFNIAIGVDDNDGNGNSSSGAGEVAEELLVQRVDAIKAASTDDELKKFYLLALNEAKQINDQNAQQSYSKAKNQRWRELHSKGAQ